MGFTPLSRQSNPLPPPFWQAVSGPDGPDSPGDLPIPLYLRMPSHGSEHGAGSGSMSDTMYSAYSHEHSEDQGPGTQTPCMSS
jgi:hypothetical protein